MCIFNSLGARKCAPENLQARVFHVRIFGKARVFHDGCLARVTALLAGVTALAAIFADLEQELTLHIELFCLHY